MSLILFIIQHKNSANDYCAYVTVNMSWECSDLKQKEMHNSGYDRNAVELESQLKYSPAIVNHVAVELCCSICVVRQ